MRKIKFTQVSKEILADTFTPVSLYLKVRSHYPTSLLLESSDYHSHENAFSFICFHTLASFTVNNGEVTRKFPGETESVNRLTKAQRLHDELFTFFKRFEIDQGTTKFQFNGLFGYTSYDALSHFNGISLRTDQHKEYHIPEVIYCFYKYVIAIDHHKNRMNIVENLQEDEESQLVKIYDFLCSSGSYAEEFKLSGDEFSNITDDDYRKMVSLGIKDCKSGDIQQIVLSRQFSQLFKGDDFNVYRALRSINPSPYLFYFDYGDYHIFGSSPEAELKILNSKASIHPIAGTFKRTGNDEQDRRLAEALLKDRKENNEHIMLVDLAKEELSRSTKNVKVESFREVQFYSHVIHLVSKVTGDLPENSNLIKLLGETFPAGTLSGAPKKRAIQLIDRYESQNRGFYGGCIGFIGFDRTLNHAIMIRTFLSKNNCLYYQAGAGVVADSTEENELQEVNNKLAALKNAIIMAESIH